MSGVNGDLVFIGSPSDLEAERRTAWNLVESIARDEGRSDTLRPYGYEVDMDRFTATTGPQQQIQERLETADVVVCLVAERLGTPLPDDFVGPTDGSLVRLLEEPVAHGWPPRPPVTEARALPLTGTVYEFLFGRSRGKHVLVYVKGDQSALAALPIEQRQLGNLEYYQRLRTASGGMLPNDVEAKYREQYGWVCRFIDRFMHERARGTFENFRDTEELERKLGSALKRLLGIVSPETAAPSVGLGFFEKQHAAHFRGREEAKADFLAWRKECLRQRQRHLAIIAGVPGVGKSSFLRAGVAYALARGEAGLPRHTVCVCSIGDLVSQAMSPLRRLLVALEAALLDAGRSVPWGESDVARWGGDSCPGDEIVSRLSGKLADVTPSPPFLLAIDQAEQLLAIPKQEGVGFGELAPWMPVLDVVRALSVSERDVALLALPSGWVPSFSRHERIRPALALREDTTRFVLDIPGRTAARSIVERFFRDRNIPITRDLVDDLIGQVFDTPEMHPESRSYLPLLSVTLAKLEREWRRESERRFRHGSRAASDPMAADFRLDKVASGARAQIAGVLDELGEQAYRDLETKSGGKWAAERKLDSLLRRLVYVDAKGSGGGAGPALALRNEAADVLTESQLLVLLCLERQRLAEIKDGRWTLVHEAVLGGWKRARAWVEANGEETIIARAMKRRAHQWNADGRREKDLADEEWAFSEGLDAPAGFTDIERVYGVWNADLDPVTRVWAEQSLFRFATKGVERDAHGVPRLYWIACSGNPGLIRRYLELFPKAINAMPPKIKITPLYGVAFSDAPEAVDLLLRAGARPNARTNDGVTALAVAAAAGYLEVCRVLLDAGAKPRPAKGDGSVLRGAIQEGHLPVVELLVGRDKGLVDLWGMGKRTPLMVAAASGHVGIARFLLDHGANPARRLKDGERALDAAAQEGHRPMIALILEHAPALLDAPGYKGRTALAAAAAAGHREVVGDLIGRGAKVSSRTRATAPLLVAAALGHGEIVKLLVGKFPESVNAPHRGLITPLMVAAHHGHGEIVEFLLDHGADARRKASDGAGALEQAAAGGHVHIVRLLLDGSLPTEKQRALAAGIVAGNLGVVRLLVERQADPDTELADNRDGMGLAILYGHPAIVQELLESSPDRVGRLDDSGAPPLARLLWRLGREAVQSVLDRLRARAALIPLLFAPPPLPLDTDLTTDAGLAAWTGLRGLSGRWSSFIPSQRRHILRQLDDFETTYGDDRTILRNSVLSVRYLDLACYPKLRLVEALCEDAVQPGRQRMRIWMVQRDTDECVTILGGTSAPFHFLNDAGYLELSDVEGRASYLRLFCQLVFAGSGGPFQIVERWEDMGTPVPHDPALSEGALSQIADNPDGGYGALRLDALVEHDNVLYQSTFVLKAGGLLEMSKDTVLLMCPATTQRAQDHGYFVMSEREGSDWSSLHWPVLLAIAANRPDLVARLSPDDGKSNMDRAVEGRQLGIVRLLLERGGDPGAWIDSAGDTVLARLDRMGGISAASMKWLRDELAKLPAFASVFAATELPPEAFGRSSAEEYQAWAGLRGLEGAWRPLDDPTRSLALAALDRFEVQRGYGRTLLRQEVTSVRVLELSFYPALVLIEAICRDRGNGRCRVRAWLAAKDDDQTCVAILAGPAATIFGVNAQVSLTLSGSEDRRRYLRFLCQYSYGPRASVEIIESVEDIALRAPLDGAFSATSIASATCLRDLNGARDAQATLKGTARLGHELYELRFEIDPNGIVRALDPIRLFVRPPCSRRLLRNGFFEIVDEEAQPAASWPLMLAVALNLTEAVDKLLPSVSLEVVGARDVDQPHVFEQALLLDRAEIVAKIVGALPDSLDLPCREGRSAAMVAAAADARAVLDRLLRPDLRVRARLAHRAADGSHALELAVAEGHLEAVRVLLNADPSLAGIPGKGERAIASAVEEAPANVRGELLQMLSGRA